MIAAPPTTFHGPIREYVEAYVVPSFPPVDSLVRWTSSLLDYYSTPKPTCVVRGRAGGRGAPRKAGDLTVVESDNSPGRWCYLRALDGTVDPATIGQILATGKLPVLYAASIEEQVGWTYGEAMSGRDKKLFSAPGLKHCHIEDALDGAPADLRVRSLRNLCPVNHFLWPMPKRFTMRRLGWTEPSMPVDLGESQTVIACVQNFLLEHLGAEGREVYARYLRTVGGRVRRATGDQVIEVRALALQQAVPASSPRPFTTGAPATSSPRLAPSAPTSAYWAAVLGRGQSNPRARILAVAPDHGARLDRLRAGLTVEQFVGIANSLFNECDPKDLGIAAPGNTRKQSETAWAYLERAKQRPKLGGKWATCVDVLRPGAPAGLVTLAKLDLEGFVTAANSVVGQVYRKVTGSLN